MYKFIAIIPHIIMSDGLNQKYLNMPHRSFKTRAQVLVGNTQGLKGLFNMVNLSLAIQLIINRLLIYESIFCMSL